MYLMKKLNFQRASPNKALRYVFIAFISTLLTFFSKVRADEPLGEISIRLSGNIVAQTCSAEPEDVNKTVELGHWPTRQLRNVSDHTIPVHFVISLKGCTGSGVKVAFMGEKDRSDPTLLAINSNSGATGVAIEIMDMNHNRVDMGDNSERISIDSNGDARLNFFAQYVAVSSPVSAGSANADSEFILTYD